MKKQLLKFTNIDLLYKFGVYKISFKNNRKFYIGSTQAGKTSSKKSDKGFYNRWSKHIWMLENNTHPNPYLQNAFNKYGIENLEFSILEICQNVIEREQYYLDNLKPYDRSIGYNIQNTVSKVICCPSVNRKPVIEYSLEGNLIKIWSSTKEASDAFKVSSTSIHYVLKGKNDTACNRLWKYYTENYKQKIKPFVKVNKTCKKVYMYSKELKFLKEFKSVKEASNYIKGSSGTMSHNINHKKGKYKGFIFRYSKLKI